VKKKLILMFLIAIMLVGSSITMASPTEIGDIDFGENPWGGHWGIIYRNYLDDSHEGTINSYFHIKAEDLFSRRWNRTVDGEYYEGGDPVETIIGSKLGVDYSPYVARFSENVMGIRLSKMDAFNFKFDAAYGLGYMSDIWAEEWKLEQTKAAVQPLAINATGDITKYLDVDATLLHYGQEQDNGDVKGYNNIGLSTTSDLTDKLSLETNAASYGQNDEHLYKVDASYELLPSLLEVRASTYGNDIEDVNSEAIRGPEIGGDNESAYIYDTDSISGVYDRDNGYGFGGTMWLDLAGIENELDVEVHSTNPDEADDIRSTVDANITTELAGFTVEQNPFMARADGGQEGYLYYNLSAVTPEYSLQPGNLNNININFRYDFDYDQNYYEADKFRTYNQAGAVMNTTQDIGGFKDVTFDSIAMLDMPDDLMWNPSAIDDYSTDLFKYGLMASYTAPNDIQFRIQYFSSQDYFTPPEDGRGNDRYEDYRWYTDNDDDDQTNDEDDKFGGLRMIMAVPF